ncbi:MAG: hypothetical protein JWP87_1421 [Labilithrix sp.]|nr:hypothetical protein [Labilithrix sp.]
MRRGLALLVSLSSVACSDPVRDDAVARLGPEAAGVSPGPLHRPGQPCLVCHSERGPASDTPFVLAGTVFETPSASSPPAKGIAIVVRDAENHSPGVFETNAAGNFFITEKDWPDMAFPVRVGIERDGKRKEMTTSVNREGSCNFCHRPATNSRYAIAGDEPRSSIGPIDFEGAR